MNAARLLSAKETMRLQLLRSTDKQRAVEFIAAVLRKDSRQVALTCPQCGETFTVYECDAHRRRCCSRECAQEYACTSTT